MQKSRALQMNYACGRPLGYFRVLSYNGDIVDKKDRLCLFVGRTESMSGAIRLFCITAIALCSVSGLAYAVEPAYTGQFGNPEEPALRPVKWLWHGTKSLFYHSFIHFRDMKQRGLCDSLCETPRGVRRGTVGLGESAFKGAIGSRVPGKKAYRTLGHWNQVLEKQEFMQHKSCEEREETPVIETAGLDAASKPATPKVASGGEKELTAPAAQPARTGSRVDRAQRDYLGDRRQTYVSRSYRGNLLRLAK